MFIAGEWGRVDVGSRTLPRDDRSIGPRGADRFATLGLHARRFVLASVSLLLASCSSLQLGYNNADTLLAYALDSHLDLDDEQQRFAAERIAVLHRWHRSTQLDGYAQLLTDAQRRVAGPVSADDVREFGAAINRQLAAIGAQAAPDLARLALTLRPAQLERLDEKLARETAKARRGLARAAGAASPEPRVERFVERAQDWFGPLTPAQRQLVRASAAQRPEAQDAWLQEREQRNRELVALLGRIRSEQPPPELAADWLREYFHALAEPRDPERRDRLARLRQDNAELIAQLINGASLAQRAAIVKRLRGYAADFSALAAQRGAGGRG